MRYLSATRIHTGQAFLPHTTILVLSEQGLIKDIVEASTIDEGSIEKYDGILCPGFVNTHCHLELSHLKHKIPQHTGIVDFGLNIIRSRNEVPLEAQQELMLEADKQMWEQGIVAVGDISNNANSLAAKQNSSIQYHTFIELIALNPERAGLVFDSGQTLLEQFEKSGLHASLAPHAPYSVSLELIRLISKQCAQKNLPTSIHNQESKAENEFFMYKSGDYLRLYETLGLPPDYFKPTGKSSLLSVAEALEPAVNTLLVHNTFSSEADISINATLPNLFWCLCPNANLYIENTLPAIDMLTGKQCRLTIGTDSLASNHQLSVIEEINTILKRYPTIDSGVLLQAATFNGALFLGIQDQSGNIAINKAPGINLISGEPGNYTVKKLA